MDRMYLRLMITISALIVAGIDMILNSRYFAIIVWFMMAFVYDNLLGDRNG